MKEEKLFDLLSRMTTTEKVGQLNQSMPSLVGTFDVDFDELLNMMFDGKISEEEFQKKLSSGSRDFHEDEIRQGLISSMGTVITADECNRLQHIAVEESRLGIPLLFGYDVIHGMRTVFPVPVGESCSFNMDLIEQSAAIAAEEAAACGIHVTFAPMLDISRDARWGRISEGSGEDPFLTSCIAKAKVRGFQGTDRSSPDKLLACAKHMAGYGACEGGRDYNSTEISEQTLRDVYLYPFKSAIKEGVSCIMPAFHDINGIPCSANKHLLKDIVRDEYGFDGVYISDANAVAELENHRICNNAEGAARAAITSGICIDMTSGTYINNLAKLADEDPEIMASLDDAVLKVLQLKNRKGLFESPYTNTERSKSIFSAEHLEVAQKSAESSMVLLKNNGIPPLSRQKSVLLVGNLADSGTDQMGAWAIAGNGADSVTIYSAMNKEFSDLTYINVDAINGTFDPDDIINAARDCDVLIAVVGETAKMSGEASSRADISLPGKQQELLDLLKTIGRPLIVLLENGRPLSIPWIKENADAILEIWQPGTMGGPAVARTLLGEVNPSGKLTVTFPYSSGQCPVYYNHRNTGRPAGKFKFTSKYIDIPFEPVFPFGYGLSYTTFKYSDLSACVENDILKAQITITNTGDRAGREVSQLYISDMDASVSRPVKELKGFKDVTLDPGESRRIEICVPVCELGFSNENLQYIVEPGTFKVMVGTDSENFSECFVEIR